MLSSALRSPKIIIAIGILSTLINCREHKGIIWFPGIDNEDLPAPLTIAYPQSGYSLILDQEIPEIRPQLTGSSLTDCKAVPTLPDGLTIEPRSCIITGTPSKETHESTYTIIASNRFESASTELRISTILIGTPPSIGFEGSPFTLTKNNAITPLKPDLTGSPTITCHSSPALPAGLSIHSDTCVISGTPTVQQPSQQYTITAENSYGMGTAEIAIIVTGDSEIPTITIENIRNNGTLESGFIVGKATASTTIQLVEASLDDGPYQAVSGTSSWKYKLPTDSSMRYKSMHTIGIRSKDIHGNYSDIITLQFQKGSNKDIDGNGYADVIVGANQYSNNTGRVFIFHSKGTHGINGEYSHQASRIITGEPASGFGTAIASADINGDAYGDLIVSAPSAGNQGRVYVFFSSGDAGIVITSALLASNTITGQSSSWIGNSLDVADFNGDGYADIVVGAYMAANTAGRVYVFHSTGLLGITASSASEATNIINGVPSGPYGRFGYYVATGDINGDGYGDIVVGGRDGNSYAHRAYVFHSSGSEGITASSAESASTIIEGGSTSSFAFSLAVGDINGDRYDDIAVGTTYRSIVYLFHSSGPSGITIFDASSASATVANPTATYFGTTVSLGDLNGDGYADLIVSDHDYASNTGRVYTFHSSGIDGIVSTTAQFASSTITGEMTNSFLGMEALSASDINGDGYQDLLIGARGYDAYAGRVYIFSSGVEGVNSGSVSSASSIISGPSLSSFGISIK